MSRFDDQLRTRISIKVILHQEFRLTRKFPKKFILNSLIPSEILEVTCGQQKGSLQMAQSEAFGK